jgi:hypothetical protein
VWFLYNVPRGDLILCNLWLSVYMDILLYALIVGLCGCITNGSVVYFDVGIFWYEDYIILSHLLVHCIDTTPDDGQLWAETCRVINKYM